MRNNLLLLLSAVFITLSCEDSSIEKDPKDKILIQTGYVVNLEYNSATVQGEVIELGEGVYDVGICYSINSEPTVADSIVYSSNVLGAFNVELINLESQTKYYFRAFISDGEEIFYGEIKEFTTKIDPLYYQLVVYYPFNGNTNDESENGYHATNYGASLTTDRFGNQNSAYYFDGIDDYVNCGSEMNISSKAFTISYWIKAEEKEGNACIIERYEENNESKFGFKSYITDNSDLYFYARNTDKDQIYYFYTTEINMQDNNWRHVAIIASRAEAGESRDVIEMWIDGEFWFANILEYEADVTRFGELIIGNLKTDIDENAMPFKGIIDDVRIYNRGITYQEMLGLYHEGGWDE